MSRNLGTGRQRIGVLASGSWKSLSVGLLGAEKKEISESAPRVLSRVLSEIGELSGVLLRVLSREVVLLFCTESILESTLGSTPESTPISESTCESTFGDFPSLGSLAGQQTRNAWKNVSL